VDRPPGGDRIVTNSLQPGSEEGYGNFGNMGIVTSVTPFFFYGVWRTQPVCAAARPAGPRWRWRELQSPASRAQRQLRAHGSWERRAVQSASIVGIIEGCHCPDRVVLELLPEHVRVRRLLCLTGMWING
jgi:hypothetical protein